MGEEPHSSSQTWALTSLKFLWFFLPSLLGSFTCSDVITDVGEEQLKPPEFIFISQHNVFSFICSIYVGGEVPSHWILN